MNSRIYLKDQGFKILGDIDWVKLTRNARVRNSVGYYSSHGREICIVASIGNVSINQEEFQRDFSEPIMEETVGMSQKPRKIYERMERMVEDFKGQEKMLELFGRRENMRSDWITIGFETLDVSGETTCYIPEAHVDTGKKSREPKA